MTNRTPRDWYESELVKLSMVASVEPIDYLTANAECGAAWLLILADGIRALQCYCLATGGQMVVLTDGSRIDSGVDV